MGYGRRVIQQEHIQVLFEVLVRLCLWHHVLLVHFNRFVNIAQLVMIEKVLCLVQDTVGLARHVDW